MINKIKQFIRCFPYSTFSMFLYYLWWLYLLYFLYYKEYDNNSAGSIALIGVATITLIFFISLLICFAIPIIKKEKNRTVYLLFIVMLVLPCILSYLFEI